MTQKVLGKREFRRAGWLCWGKRTECLLSDGAVMERQLLGGKGGGTRAFIFWPRILSACLCLRPHKYVPRNSKLQQAEPRYLIGPTYCATHQDAQRGKIPELGWRVRQGLGLILGLTPSGSTHHPTNAYCPPPPLSAREEGSRKRGIGSSPMQGGGRRRAASRWITAQGCLDSALDY